MSKHILFFIFLMSVKNYNCNIMLSQFKTELGDWRQNIPKSGMDILECISTDFLERIHAFTRIISGNF